MVVYHFFPRSGAVTGIATAGVVGGLHIARMAGITRGEVAVVEVHILPTARGVTIRALPAIVVALAVTSGAIVEAVVIEHHLIPINGSVTIRALTAIVLFLAVTGCAVVKPGVIEGHLAPIFGIVAIGACPCVVIGRCMLHMTLGALTLLFMAKCYG